MKVTILRRNPERGFRMKNTQKPIKLYEYGPLRVDQAKREVTLHEQLIPLDDREFDILWLLVTHPNEALPCAFLHNVLWAHPDPEHGEEKVICCVQSLQRKLHLEQLPFPFQIVSEETARGKGYKFYEIK